MVVAVLTSFMQQVGYAVSLIRRMQRHIRQVIICRIFLTIDVVYGIFQNFAVCRVDGSVSVSLGKI